MPPVWGGTAKSAVLRTDPSSCHESSYERVLRAEHRLWMKAQFGSPVHTVHWLLLRAGCLHPAPASDSLIRAGSRETHTDRHPPESVAVPAGEASP